MYLDRIARNTNLSKDGGLFPAFPLGVSRLMETHLLVQLQEIQEDGTHANVPLLLLIRPD